MNQFVQYLDQYNAFSPNHAKIYDEYTGGENEFSFRIETRIEQFLLELYQEQPKSVIMTGNAGDGKTRLCRMIYEELSGRKLDKWPANGIVDIPYIKGTVRIVKDLSELTETVIAEELLRLQHQIKTRHSDRIYYLIAANEGKLTKCLSESNELSDLSNLVRERFLDHDCNTDGNPLHLVNLQDVTSSRYADRILEEWNQDKYWEACNSCSKAPQCVIRLNHRRTKEPRIHKRLVEQYRLLDCLGVHVTMREILLHISFVLTGGLTCQQVLNARHEEIEEQASHAYYDNFYGVYLPEQYSGELGAIRHFKRLDPGRLSITTIDDFLLNGDISGDEATIAKHRLLFDEEIDLMFGYYRKQIERFRTLTEESDSEQIAKRMPQLRRKFFFEAADEDRDAVARLIPYTHFHTYLETLKQPQSSNKVRNELIQGLNHAFSRKLIRRNETQLVVSNENLFIYDLQQAKYVRLSRNKEREDIDYEPSTLILTIHNTGLSLKVSLAVFEYLRRLSRGGLFATLRQETEILLNTFKNELINLAELNDETLDLLIFNTKEGVYAPGSIEL